MIVCYTNADTEEKNFVPIKPKNTTACLSSIGYEKNRAQINVKLKVVGNVTKADADISIHHQMKFIFRHFDCTQKHLIVKIACKQKHA